MSAVPPPGRSIEAMIPYPAPQAAPGAKPYFGDFPVVPRPMMVENLRGRAEAPSLDREGFMLTRWPSAVRDFRDPREVERTYLREIIALLRHVTGAGKVLPLSTGLVRLSPRSPESATVGIGPGAFVHADYTAASGPFWVRHVLRAAEAEERLEKRYAIYNVWRATSPPPQDLPLALCDARTVAPEDLVRCDFTVRERGRAFSFENAAYTHNPAHRWCYFPDMERDEVLVFRGFDSAPGGDCAAPHTAFEDPTCPSGAPARESIDIRAIAFFD